MLTESSKMISDTTVSVYFTDGINQGETMSTIMVIRKVYGKYKREHCVAQFDKSLMSDFELWCKSNLAKLYKKHGVKNIEIRL